MQLSSAFDQFYFLILIEIQPLCTAQLFWIYFCLITHYYFRFAFGLPLTRQSQTQPPGSVFGGEGGTPPHERRHQASEIWNA